MLSAPAPLRPSIFGQLGETVEHRASLGLITTRSKQRVSRSRKSDSPPKSAKSTSHKRLDRTGIPEGPKQTLKKAKTSREREKKQRQLKQCQAKRNPQERAERLKRGLPDPKTPRVEADQPLFQGYRRFENGRSQCR
ncbi:unnamed protein product [Penicillium bialowiezense]